jgi:hypothetical protein
MFVFISVFAFSHENVSSVNENKQNSVIDYKIIMQNDFACYPDYPDPDPGPFPYPEDPFPPKPKSKIIEVV